MWYWLILTGKIVLGIVGCLFFLLAGTVLWQEKIAPNRGIVWAFWSVMNMVRKRESVWAVGFHGAVELRASIKRPRAVTSEVERDTFRTETQMFQDDEGKWKRKRVKLPHKIVLDNTIHVGGRVLKTMEWRAFWIATGMNVNPGDVIQVPKPQAIKALGRRAYGD